MNDQLGIIVRSAIDERGVASIEYALVSSLIAMVCALSVRAFGESVIALYTLVCNTVTTAISGAPAC